MMKKIDIRWLQKNKVHLIVWSIFIAYETVVIGLIYNIYGNPLTYFLHYTIIIAFFYAYADKGLPWAFKKNQDIWFKVPGVIVLSLCIYIGLHYVADLVLIATGVIEHNGKYEFTYQFALKNLYRGIYFMGFSTGYYLLKIRDVERREKEALKQLNFDAILKQQKTEQELSLTQNAFLKAQINPHFLFNTLDFVYHSVHSNPDAASDAIIYLSRMMRFAVDANEYGEFVRLGEELVHVETLMNLYRLRKKDVFLPSLRYAPEVTSILFIPLVVLTLAENMIKHGRFNEEEDSAYLHVEMLDDVFCIHTRNAAGPPADNRPNSGAGLKNIENRLKFAYGENLHFNHYHDPKGYFITEVKIHSKYLKHNVF